MQGVDEMATWLADALFPFAAAFAAIVYWRLVAALGGDER